MDYAELLLVAAGYRSPRLQRATGRRGQGSCARRPSARPRASRPRSSGGPAAPAAARSSSRQRESVRQSLPIARRETVATPSTPLARIPPGIRLSAICRPGLGDSLRLAKRPLRDSRQKAMRKQPPWRSSPAAENRYGSNSPRCRPCVRHVG